MGLGDDIVLVLVDFCLKIARYFLWRYFVMFGKRKTGQGNVSKLGVFGGFKVYGELMSKKLWKEASNVFVYKILNHALLLFSCKGLCYDTDTLYVKNSEK